MISNRQLQIFLKIAELNSVSKAAAVLHLSQAAASMALNELEKQLSTQLFDRIGKRLSLNANGRLLLPQAQTLIEQAQHLSQLFKQVDISGQLLIGASTTIGNYLLPKYLAQFKQQHPDIEIQLHVDNTQNIGERVVQFELDMGFIEGSFIHPDLKHTKLFDDELVVFARKDHPLCLQQKISHKDLSKAAWILREQGSGTGSIVEAALSQKLDSINVFLILGNSEAIIQAVCNSDAISCLSRLCIESELQREKVAIITAPALTLKRKLSYILNKKKQPSLALQAWLTQTF